MMLLMAMSVATAIWKEMGSSRGIHLRLDMARSARTRNNICLPITLVHHSLTSQSHLLCLKDCPSRCHLLTSLGLGFQLPCSAAFAAQGLIRLRTRTKQPVPPQNVSQKCPSPPPSSPPSNLPQPSAGSSALAGAAAPSPSPTSERN